MFSDYYFLFVFMKFEKKKNNWNEKNYKLKGFKLITGSWSCCSLFIHLCIANESLSVLPTLFFFFFGCFLYHSNLNYYACVFIIYLFQLVFVIVSILVVVVVVVNCKIYYNLFTKWFHINFLIVFTFHLTYHTVGAFVLCGGSTIYFNVLLNDSFIHKSSSIHDN